MDRIDAISKDVRKSYIDGIAELIPGVVTESLNDQGEVVRAIDFDLLRQELSENIVDGPRERYQLDWPGKRQAILAANAPTSKTLRPVREESVDFDNTRNIFIEGDNLEALKILQESYLGKVDVIYIDPPYNTGNDFVYDDDFAESSSDYLLRSGQTSEIGDRLVANTEANGRFHSVWLNMMYARLKLARGLLADDGVAIVAIGDHEHGNLRLLLDQVFGSDNFIANVTWQGSGKNDARYTAGGVDYMLIYAKNENLLRSLDTRWKEPKPGIGDVEEVARRAWKEAKGDPAKATAIFRDGVRAIKSDLEPAVFRYDQIDESGRVFQATDLRSPNPRPNLQYPVVHPITARPVKMHPNGWVYSRDRMDALLADKRIIFGPDETTSPRLKRFLDEQGERVPYPTFTQVRMPGSKKLNSLIGENVFDYPKDTSVLTRWIGAITRDKPNSVVLDFFAGSGSTGQAVWELNAADNGQRRFILVQIGETVDHPDYVSIADIARERLRRAGDQVKQESGLMGDSLDTGFRSLHVATSNLADTLRSAENLAQSSLLDAVRSVKSDRTDEDLLFQVLLDWGLDLTEPIRVNEVHDTRVLSIANDALVGCFVDNLTDVVVKEMAMKRPLRAVFLDSAFKTDAERVNVVQIFRELSPDTQVRVI